MLFNRFIAFAFAAFLPLAAFGQVISIAAARALPAGTQVKVRGVVTNGAELGKIRYLQDGTAGIAAFPGNGSIPGFETGVKLGDSIEVSGTLLDFQDLLEISPITSFSVVSSGNPLPAPKTITLAGINESLESQLIRVECASFQSAGTFASSGTYDVLDPTGTTGHVFLRTGNPIIGSSVPSGPSHLTAIVSQYVEYQLLPRTLDDLVPAPCFFLTQTPQQSDIQTTGFTVTWKTNQSSSTKLLYGETPVPDKTLSLANSTTNHSVSLSGLIPGAVYWVQAVATHNGETIQSDVVPFATRSLSSGEIQVFFNHPVDPDFVGDQTPAGQSYPECIAAIIDRIDKAKSAIDVSMYNNGRSDLTNALKAAHARGVRVRYVAALAGGSDALTPPPPFPVIYGNATALMHNKFMVIDADDASNCWVMGGSMNWTDENIEKDFNNLLFVQDQSLARTYELEFEEMWGSSGDQPDVSKSRFGLAKKDNTPHRFIIGDHAVECYFSPSDGVTKRIVETIESTDASVEFALFTFTKNEPADAFTEVFAAGLGVRGLIENTNDQGSEFNFLLGQGIPVAQHTQNGQLHHKYCVVDALLPEQYDPLVLTGSHNWSQTAETSNDENTLVIHNPDIARLYRAEFEKRATENPIATHAPQKTDFQLFPNPAIDRFWLQSVEELESGSVVQVLNIAGQNLFEYRVQVPAAVLEIPLGAVPPGFYFVKISNRHGFAALPLQTFPR